ncbi:hypothetical protein [Nitrospirillum iridis]|uniref:Uncharacterized protein n=1 Tax=Nitrospirillum iridis TaxID=765888 RepID=A0A7X0AVY3_9PROT|nr:hypothetical protein [Nitrospirillum iridis]MBB6250271.1 hypothetical protein [Nitrospirillum iridis]
MFRHSSKNKPSSTRQPGRASQPAGAPDATTGMAPPSRIGGGLAAMGADLNRGPSVTALRQLTATLAGRAPTPGQDVVQRQVIFTGGSPDESTWRPLNIESMSDVRHFLTEVQGDIHSLGFKLQNGGIARVHEWLTGDQPIKFADKAALIQKLFELDFCFRPQKHASSGPKTLGPRPTFQGGANAMAYGKDHGDTARRHVISSSTLGLAIEKSQANLQVVNGFLERWGGQAVQEQTPAALHVAKRQAWTIAHNHVGNLWVGPSPINTAIGFIRGPFLAAVKILQHQEGPFPVQELVDYYAQPQGPMNKAAQKEWQDLAEILTPALEGLADSDGKIESPEEAIDLILDFARNADLDMPQEKQNPGYHSTVTGLYSMILGAVQTGEDIFQPDAALDLFMRTRNGEEDTAMEVE